MTDLFESILNALPANLALLDHKGVIIFVNDEWKNFADQNQLNYSNYGIGKNYLDICYSAVKDLSGLAKKAARGIKKVLQGKSHQFTLEYPCHSPDEKRWFRLFVKPVWYLGKLGAVVMHINITERVLAEEELNKSLQQLRFLSAHLESIREEERINVAREIHDDLGQPLIAIKLKAQSINRQIPKEYIKAIQSTVEMSKLISQTIDSVHRITEKLRPEILNSIGLIPAIQWQVDKFNKLSRIKYILNILRNTDIHFDKSAETNIFRFIQEALTNILKHSNATEATIDLNINSKYFTMTIKDNGKGITKKQTENPTSYGIISMKERAIFVGGEFKIEGEKGKGTTVILSILFK